MFSLVKSSLLFVFTIFFSCINKNSVLSEVKQLPHYPSASGVEYFRKHFFIIGDDAKYVLILDSNLTTVDSIALYSFPGQKIPKNIKPDLEAIALIRDRDKSRLFIPGSGSISPYREMAWLIDPLTKQKDSIRLDTFYRRLKAKDVQELNIEGACSIPGAFVFSNRGSKGYPKNHLVLTKQEFWKDQTHAPITLIHMGATEDSTVFNGISGLVYSAKSDQLLLTVTTEDTKNSLEDGTIGKSYLWIVKNISGKRGWKGINPNRMIDLEKVDQRFKGQKIESVCITNETKKILHLVLAADNDNGSSTLFRLVVEKD